MHKLLQSIFLIAIIILFSQCDSKKVYENNKTLKNGKWVISNTPEFTFSIPDKSKRYNIYYNIRYSLSYSYHNIYLKYRLQDSAGKNLQSELHEVHLFDKKSGKPRGEGISNIFDLQTLAIKNKKFPYEGEYSISLEQYMRTDTLSHIKAVGIRVEKAGKKK